MIAFQIIGILTVCVLFVYGIIRLVAPCPVNHDDIARQGATECPRCKEEV